MTRVQFAEYANNIVHEGGSLTLNAVLRHIINEHNNDSWIATLTDLAQVVEEITGCDKIKDPERPDL